MKTRVTCRFPLPSVTLREYLSSPVGTGRFWQKAPTGILALAFPVGLLFGATIAIYTGSSDHVAWVNRISFVALGLLVAAAVRLPPAGLVAISLFFGVSHGYENTAGISQNVAVLMFVPGVLVCGLAMVAIVAAVSLTLPWQKIAVRVAGSWIAAIGLLIIGLAR